LACPDSVTAIGDALTVGAVIELDAIRALAVTLPAVDEAPWYGAPAFRVRGRVFARLHENDGDLFLIKVGSDERDALVAEQPTRFLRTDHRSERDDSVLMRLSATTAVDLPEVAELLETAWRRVAPPRLRATFDDP
jgi:hypothetical protein